MIYFVLFAICFLIVCRLIGFFYLTIIWRRLIEETEYRSIYIDLPFGLQLGFFINR